MAAAILRKQQKRVKTHAMIGTVTHVVASVVVTEGEANDWPEMPGLVQRTIPRFEVDEVQGDKAYLCYANLEDITDGRRHALHPVQGQLHLARLDRRQGLGSVAQDGAGLGTKKRRGP